MCNQTTLTPTCWALFSPLTSPLSHTHTHKHTHAHTHFTSPYFLCPFFFFSVRCCMILIYFMHNFKRLFMYQTFYYFDKLVSPKNSTFFVFHFVFEIFVSSSIFLSLYSVRSKSLNIFSVLSQEINLWHSRNSDVELVCSEKKSRLYFKFFSFLAHSFLSFQ